MEKTMCELFAGVGGFRIGMENIQKGWETVWFSQWEPKATVQHAYNCYVSHFGDCKDLKGEYHTNDDISIVDKNTIPDHTLLVGGFPCQDYSVARGLSGEKGIEGKKGVLWWQIMETITAKKPSFCLFENVDRLLKSPSTQRGRDFGIMLSCLNSEGYAVEWRVINAATYGAAQRRRRTFIFAYKNTTEHFKNQNTYLSEDIILKEGLMANAFPISEILEYRTCEIDSDVYKVSSEFSFEFLQSGYMKDGFIYTAKVKEREEEPVKLKQILQSYVDESFYIPTSKIDKWTYLKGGKKIERVAKNGHRYIYSEGPVAFPDDWDKPGRTMLTSESTLNRSSHVVADPGTGRLRIITPIEAERLQGFPDDWTNSGMTQRMRYFCMGNALVVPMIERMGRIIDEIVEKEK